MTFLTVPERANIQSVSCTCWGTNVTYSCKHTSPCNGKCSILEICTTPGGLKASPTGLGTVSN